MDFFFFYMQSCCDVTVLKYFLLAGLELSERTPTAGDHGDVQEFHRSLSFPKLSAQRRMLLNDRPEETGRGWIVLNMMDLHN